MNIQEEKISDLNAIVRIQVAHQDYENKLEDSLRDLGKKVQIKGFRPGKVPKSLVRKIYGNQVLAEQLDTIVREQLSSFLKDKDTRILGQPLPQDTEALTIDVNAPSDYEFSYEIGLSPEFTIPALSTTTQLPRMRVTPDEAMVDKEWDRMLRQQGKLEEVQEVEEGDLLYMRFVELDDSGEIKPGGAYKDSVINQDMIVDKELAAKAIGLKAGNSLIFADLPAALGREHQSVVQYMLGVKENIDQVGKSFRAELTGIKRNTPTEPNQEFLDKIFGAGKVDSPEAARAVIREELSRVYNQRTDRTFNDSLVEHLLDNTEIPLPEPFLHKWLLSQKENENAEIGEEEFAYFRRNLKWSLIYNKVARDNGAEVTREEIESSVRADVSRHYGSAFESLEEDDLNGLVGRLLQDQEYLEKVHSGILDARVFHILHQSISIIDQPVSLEEYENSLKDSPEAED